MTNDKLIMYDILYIIYMVIWNVNYMDTQQV